MARAKPKLHDFSRLPVREALRRELERISSTCVDCGVCAKECAFLRKYGSPKQIADAYDPSEEKHRAMCFECSLCGLCGIVCPVGVNPAEMFLQMRNETVARGDGVYSEHGMLLGYERRGTSRRYSYYGLPEGCETVFFPGCTLPGTRPDKTFSIFEQLRRSVPSLGIVLDCCTKISHDLGREDYFAVMFGEMKDFLTDHGVGEVLVACPNCHKVFARHGGDLKVKTVYEVLAGNGWIPLRTVSGMVTVHDPCSVRTEETVHDAVRRLIRKQGLEVKEMAHSGVKTVCCGEGGSVACLAPEFPGRWGTIREEEAGNRRIVTYCAGCAGFLNRRTPTDHVLDLIFDPEAVMRGKNKVAKAPFTYLNRIRLKKRFKKAVDSAVTRERTFNASKT